MPASLPPFEEWKAPWETRGEELDADRAKRFIYDLMREKQSHQLRRDRMQDEIKDLKLELEAADGLGQRRGKKNEPEQEEESVGESKQQQDLAHENDLLKVRLETGLSEKAVKRLVGDTYDELLADAKDYMEEHGIAKSDDSEAGGGSDGDESGDEQSSQDEKPEMRRAPRRNATKTGLGDNQDPERTPKPSELESLFS